MDRTKTTRNGFDPNYVLKNVEDAPEDEIRRVLAEACHLILATRRQTQFLGCWLHDMDKSYSELCDVVYGYAVVSGVVNREREEKGGE